MLIGFCSSSYAGKITYNNHNSLCRTIYKEYSHSIKQCTETLSKCIVRGLNTINNKLEHIDPEKISINHYGYTTISKINLGNNLIALHLNLFHGDRRWRLLETWIVNELDLQKVLNITPGPVSYSIKTPDPRIAIGKKRPNREINSIPFSSMLNKSKKISDQTISFYKWDDRIFYIENEFKAKFAYGGYQYEQSINKASVKEIESTGEIISACDMIFSSLDQLGNSPEQNFRLKMEGYVKTIFNSKDTQERRTAAMWFTNSFTANGADPTKFLDLVIDNKPKFIEALDDKDKVVAKYIQKLMEVIPPN